MGRLGLFAVAALTLVLLAWLGGAFLNTPEGSRIRPTADGSVAAGGMPEAPPPSTGTAGLPRNAPATVGTASSPAPAGLPRSSEITPAVPEPARTEAVRPAAETATGSAVAAPAASSPVGSTAPATAATPVGAAGPATSEPARPRQEPPRFDVARVGARGALVTAGRAAPGSEVLLLENGREIGRGRADARGEWVILPEAPLVPGARELTLTARLPGGEPLAGEASVLLVVPGPAALADSRPAPGGASTVTADPSPAPLALLLPAPGSAAPIRALQASAAARLSIDLVDYAGAAGMRFAGAAPTGAPLRLYIDDVPAGELVADAQGRWSYSPASQPSVGRHVLRIDHLGPQGQVVSRVEQPFQRDPPPAANAAAGDAVPGRYIVQPGNNLWRIARGTYGEGMRYTQIFAANRDQIRNPDLIYPGQVFTLPGAAP